ncbi:MAG TPA: gluconate:H+ symporter [Terracidiphilus sp.]|nr:gluconate:H+ symporter [Terracidiphilus sp.]
MNPAPVTAHDWYLLACVAGTVLFLLLLVVKFKLHAALGLSMAALALGVAAGMPLKQVPLSFTAGVGNMMGHIAIILGMGAILGQLLASSGGAASLSRTLVEGCGPKGLPWALLGLSLLVGMPVFFEVGLVLLMPIVVEAARRAKRPPILVALPVLAGLSITHGLIPPHPSALLAATVFHADLGRVILWGMMAGSAASALAGPGVYWVLVRRWERNQSKLAMPEPLEFASTNADARSTVTPAGPVRALISILLPIALIFVGSWADSVTVPGGIPNQIMHVLGYPDVAMLTAVLVALVTLGSKIPREPHHGPDMLRKLTADSFVPIAGVLVILSAAGGLSGVLRDSGAAQATVGLALGAHMPPLLLAWALAALVRVCMGSSTVAMAVASGVLAPVAGSMGVRPEMLVLATGCGSLLLSHVNDSGFWLVGSLFKLDVKATLSTWSVVETVLSITGLCVTMALASILHW